MPSKKHESRIVICMDPEGYGNQSFAGWSSDYNLYYSDDFLESKTLVIIDNEQGSQIMCGIQAHGRLSFHGHLQFKKRFEVLYTW